MWVVMSDEWGVGRGLDVTGKNLEKIQHTLSEAAGRHDGARRIVRGTWIGETSETDVNVTGLSGLRLISE